MTTALSLIALLAIFIVGTTTRINMGVLAFAGAFAIGGLASNIPVDAIVDEFPGNIFVIVVGVTLLFGIAAANGTLELIIDGALHLVGGRRWAIVWLMFALSSLLMALGAVLAVAMLAPIAMPLARRHGIDRLLMGMMLCHGALGTAFSPLNIFGAFLTSVTEAEGIAGNRLVTFLAPLALNAAFAAVLFFWRGRSLIRSTPHIAAAVPVHAGLHAEHRPAVDDAGVRDSSATSNDSARSRVQIGASLVGMVALLILSLGFGVDIGVSSMCIAAALLILNPVIAPTAMKSVSWNTILLVCGMLTYMYVLTKNGTLAAVSDGATKIGSPMLAALLICYAVAIVSALGSSLGTLGIAIPLAAPILVMGDFGTVGFVAAVAFASTVVDVSPFSSNGALLLANSPEEDRDKLQQQMLGYCALLVAIAPLVAWATLIAPGFG